MVIMQSYHIRQQRGKEVVTLIGWVTESGSSVANIRERGEVAILHWLHVWVANVPYRRHKSDGS
jgi:hypothetical protein